MTEKNRVLLLPSRNITTQHRHFLNDLQDLLPHAKKENKMDHKSGITLINELCDLRSCNGCIFLEARKKRDLYMWLSRAPTGPSVKFQVVNVHTMMELRMTGNCLKGSRPLLSFDNNFDSQPHYQLLKQIFTHIFATPKGHPHSKPFIDHVFSFSIIDDRIWFRNYQIVWPADPKSKIELVEIGPRFVLNLIRVFNGSFHGSTLYSNPAYITPSRLRRARHVQKSKKYKERVQEKEKSKKRKAEDVISEDELDHVFG
eukprot:c18073_g1_i1.p1 GENE.c18073_g1_i1~~c18073_g1_i1.p1  ORF type:complete len:264 (+),score=69.68 c18073_g1_i1:23-793(+)